MTNPILAQKTADNDEVLILSTGVAGKIIPVGASLIDEVVARIDYPEVPTFFDEDKGRDEENPNHPDYLKAISKTERKRAQAVVDVLVMFGLELVDGMPESTDWLKRLQFLEKRKLMDLSEYDLEDTFDLEFLYKKYIAAGTEDLIAIGRKAGLNKEAVDQAAKTFQG